MMQSGRSSAELAWIQEACARCWRRGVGRARAYGRRREPRRDHRERHRCPLGQGPSPFSGQAAATPQRLGGRCQGRGAPSAARAALTGGARLAAILSFRLAGLGCALPGRPLGGSGSAGAARRERKPRGVCGWSPSTGTAPGGRGATAQTGAARSPWKATQEPATRARRPTVRAALPSIAPWRGLGVTGTSGTGGAQRSRCLQLCPRWGADG